MKDKIIIVVISNTLLCIGAAIVGGLIVNRSNKKNSSDITLINYNQTLRSELYKSWNENEQLKKKLEKEA